jgi:hypothetical protein
LDIDANAKGLCTDVDPIENVVYPKVKNAHHGKYYVAVNYYKK